MESYMDPYMDPHMDPYMNRCNMSLCNRSLCNESLCNMSLCNKSFCNMSEPALQQTSLVLQFKDRVNAAAAVALGLPQYVPGMAINGDALREFSSTPLLCGPLVCQLCEAEFLYDDDFASVRLSHLAKGNPDSAKSPFDCLNAI